MTTLSKLPGVVSVSSPVIASPQPVPRRKEQLKNRRERLALWRACAGTHGLVDQVTAAWLLDVSKQRINVLIEKGKLDCTRKINQHLLIPFAEIERFATTKSCGNHVTANAHKLAKPLKTQGKGR